MSKKERVMIKRFEVNIEQNIVDSLKSRVKNTRWPDEIEGSDWTYGASLSYMKELADYWLNDFDWRKTEKEINKYENFIANIDGYKVHFLHIKGKGEESIPLIMTHGWPGSFLEMMKLIPILTGNSKRSFDLVIPSMLGFGFSQKLNHTGCNVSLMADIWFKLMQELGYEKFGVQGGDFGAGVSAFISLKYPDNVIGMHLNYIPGNYRPELADGEIFTKEESEFIKAEDEWYFREGGYSHQQKTKPLTLAYGLNDSPIGLCAWIIEKMYGWAECRGNIGNVFTKDELLANVMLYWVTETIHSSIRLYNENRKSPLILGGKLFIDIPVGIARFKFEEPFPPRKYIERGFNIQHWTDFTEGGHFPAIEKPELLVDDIFRFFGKIYKKG
jgi:pimeloyl-ACP methyl ester carboxylesterase